jgi:hypothetical protein
MDNPIARASGDVAGHYDYSDGINDWITGPIVE